MPDLILEMREPDRDPVMIRLVDGLTFGRDPGNRVVVHDMNASSRHAVIVREEDGRFAVEDLGSSNKTRFDEGPVLGKGERRVLEAGDVFSMGVTRFVVKLDPAQRRVARTELVQIAEPMPAETTERLQQPFAPATESAPIVAPSPVPPPDVVPEAPPPAPVEAAEEPEAVEAPVASEAVAEPPAVAKPTAKKAELPAIPPLAVGRRGPTSYSLNRFDVDLSTYLVKQSTVACEDLEDVLGGVARGFKILSRYQVADAYAEDAPIVLNLGALSGTQFMTGLRTYFHGFSPLKCDARHRPSAMWSAGSGKFGTKLRYLGIDEVVFTGRAVLPVYLHIREDAEGRTRLSFKNAAHLVGKTANEKIQHLHAKYPDAHFAVIGPGGENYKGVRYAAIALSTINQLRSGDMKSRFCGRGGFGGVLGSKNLLAIVADVQDKVRDKIDGLKEVNQHVARGEGSRRFRDAKKGDGGGGTWANMTALNPLHAMPEYNFSPTGTDVSIPLYRASVEEDGQFIVKDEACFACGIACHKNLYENTDGKKGRFRAKFDYEPLNLLSANIGIFDIDQAAHLVDLVDDLCMDSISIGVTLAYAMEYNRRRKEAGEESILPDYIQYGSYAGARRAIEEIGRGRLAVLGQGVRRLGEALGEPEYAMHCKGVEFPAYLPQHNPGYPWALAGGHMSMRTYLLYVFEREKGLDYWVDAITQRGPLIMRDDIIGICKFSGMPSDVMAPVISAMTGLELDKDALEAVVRRTYLRGYRLEKRAGFELADYVMPAEIHSEFPKVDLEHFNTLEFFTQLRDRVCERFDRMLVEEGL